jgi:predicted membrane channel-forming protein YqfA (hemolysin III family)
MNYYELDTREILDWRKPFCEQQPCGVIVTGVTAKSLLTMSPLMATGVGIILGVGAFAIIMARLEKKMAEQDNPNAEYVPFITMGLLMVGAAIGILYFLILKNPLLGAISCF